jgi:hypothetical protein
MRCGWKTEVYAVPSLRGGGEYGKNGTMQEPKCKSKMYLMISLPRQNLIAQNILPQIFLPLWWVKWRFASRCNHDTASRIDESRFAGSGSDGHVVTIYRRRRLGMIMEQHKTVKKCLNISKDILRTQRQSRNSLSGNYGNHRGSR